LLHSSWFDLYLADYSVAVTRAGGMTVALTYGAPPRELVPRLDGIILAGGSDVDPRLYGSVPDARSTELDPERDQFEIAVVESALAEGVPLLAICRGCQLLNVATGGTLCADLPLGEGESHGALNYPLDFRAHTVAFEPGTTAWRIYGQSAHVNTFHHQAVADLGRGVRATGYAPDGVVEAIEVQGAPALGVQWHPEFLAQPDPVFEWLVTLAKDKEARALEALT
jgi:putative glutamine amidotransferase